MDWQTLIALVIVGLCIWRLAVRFRSYLRRTEAGGCGCSGCPTTDVLDKLHKEREKRKGNS